MIGVSGHGSSVYFIQFDAATASDYSADARHVMRARRRARDCRERDASALPRMRAASLPLFRRLH